MMKYLLILLGLLAGYGAYSHLSEVSEAFNRAQAQIAAQVASVRAAPPTQAPAIPGQQAPAAEVASTQQAELAQRVAAAQHLAVTRYPALGVANSEINSRFIFRYKRLLAEHDARLQDPNWPVQLADECAADSAPKPKTAPAAKRRRNTALASIDAK